MPRFRAFFLRIGLPYGLLIGIGTSLPVPFAWYDFLLTTVFCAMVFAAALWSVAEVAIRWIPPTGINKAAIAFAIVIVALVVGDGTLLLVRDIPHGRFRRLPDPPAAVASIIVVPCQRWHDVRHPRLYVIDSLGRQYAYVDTDSTVGLWEPLPGSATVAALPLDSCPPFAAKPFASPWMLARVRASGQSVWLGIEGFVHRHYVVLADGTIREWMDSESAMGPYASALLMGIVSIVLAIVAYRLALRSWDPKPA
jgi:hypothetical protein